jgi:hypothetical protein
VAPQASFRTDYGPDFAKKGIVSVEPPKLGAAFPVFVPQADADGNDLAGIRIPELAVPLATFTGWNLFNEKAGPTDVMATTTGSFIPFAKTRADRERSGDPRPSIEERYKDKEDYLDRYAKSAADLASKGYLLKEDIPHMVQQAAARWDWISSQK